jgi:hypothetical protein
MGLPPLNEYVVKFQEGVVIIIEAENKFEAIEKLHEEYTTLFDSQDFEVMYVLKRL